MSITRLLFLSFFTATRLERAGAGLLGSLFGFGGNPPQEGESTTTTEQQEVQFYQEDTLANVAMMLDFVDTPLYLVALFKWRDQAVYEDGRSTTLTGFEADQLYTQAMFADIVPGVGGEPKFIANVHKTTNIIEKQGEPSFHSDWDALAVIEFPSGVAFGRMLPNQRFQDLSPSKKAGLEYHAIFACELDPLSSMGAADVGVDTAASAVSTVDLLDYRRFANYQPGDVGASRFRSGEDAVQLYYDTTSLQSIQSMVGMRTAAVFKIKHSLIMGASGVNNQWDEVRINTYPSTEALDAARAVPSSLGWHHLEAGVNREAELEVSPMFFNSLGGNAQMGYYEACATESRVQIAAAQEYDTSSFCPGAI